VVTPIKHTIPEWIFWLHRVSFPNQWGVIAFEFAMHIQYQPSIVFKNLWIVHHLQPAANDGA
jgi:hypothetical protein